MLVPVALAKSDREVEFAKLLITTGPDPGFPELPICPLRAVRFMFWLVIAVFEDTAESMLPAAARVTVLEAEVAEFVLARVTVSTAVSLIFTKLLLPLAVASKLSPEVPPLVTISAGLTFVPVPSPVIFPALARLTAGALTARRAGEEACIFPALLSEKL